MLALPQSVFIWHFAVAWWFAVLLIFKLTTFCKDPLKIAFDLRHKRIQVLAQILSQTGINCLEIGRMIQRLAVPSGQWMTDIFRWQRLVRGIRFDEQAIRRNRLECFPLVLFACMQKIAGKTEIGAQSGEGGDQLGRAPETVQQETALRPWMAAQ